MIRWITCCCIRVCVWRIILCIFLLQLSKYFVVVPLLKQNLSNGCKVQTPDHVLSFLAVVAMSLSHEGDFSWFLQRSARQSWSGTPSASWLIYSRCRLSSQALPFKTDLFSTWIIQATFTWAVLVSTLMSARYFTLYLPGWSWPHFVAVKQALQTLIYYCSLAAITLQALDNITFTNNKYSGLELTYSLAFSVKFGFN